MTVKEIIVKYLQKEGCDGLVNSVRKCSCTIKDIEEKNRNVCHRSLGCDFCLAAILLETHETIIKKEMVACHVSDDHDSRAMQPQLDY